MNTEIKSQAFINTRKASTCKINNLMLVCLVSLGLSSPFILLTKMNTLYCFAALVVVFMVMSIIACFRKQELLYSSSRSCSVMLAFYCALLGTTYLIYPPSKEVEIIIAILSITVWSASSMIAYWIVMKKIEKGDYLLKRIVKHKTPKPLLISVGLAAIFRKHLYLFSIVIISSSILAVCLIFIEAIKDVIAYRLLRTCN